VKQTGRKLSLHMWRLAKTLTYLLMLLAPSNIIWYGTWPMAVISWVWVGDNVPWQLVGYVTRIGCGPYGLKNPRTMRFPRCFLCAKVEYWLLNAEL